MNIGELARLSGIPSTALRYYEKAGLLPKSMRTSSGYRAYEVDALPRLAFIRAAQAMGLTLAEIREVIGIRDAGQHRVVTFSSCSNATAPMFSRVSASCSNSSGS